MEFSKLSHGGKSSIFTKGQKKLSKKLMAVNYNLQQTILLSLWRRKKRLVLCVFMCARRTEGKERKRVLMAATVCCALQNKEILQQQVANGSI